MCVCAYVCMRVCVCVLACECVCVLLCVGGGNLLIYPSVSGSDFIINLVLWDRTLLL